MDPLMDPFVFPPDMLPGIPGGSSPSLALPGIPPGPPALPAMPQIPPGMMPNLGAIPGMGGGYNMPDLSKIPNMMAEYGIQNGISPTQVLQGDVPLPRPRPEGAPGSAAPESRRPDLAEALRGLKAPQAPTPQTVRSPAAPHPTNRIQGGELLAMLQALGVGRGGGQQRPMLPPTLGSLIGR